MDPSTICTAHWAIWKLSTESGLNENVLYALFHVLQYREKLTPGLDFMLTDSNDYQEELKHYLSYKSYSVNSCSKRYGIFELQHCISI